MQYERVELLCDIVNVFISRLIPINFRKLCVNVKYCERKKWRRVKRHTCIYFRNEAMQNTKVKRKSENIEIKDRQQLKYFQLI